jgi:aminopeptidase N
MMKHLLVILTCLAFGLQLAAQSPEFNPSDLDQIAEAEAKANAGKITAPMLAPAGDYDVRYQRMEWQIDPSVKYIQGAITTVFTAKIAGFAVVHFDLMDALTIDSVRYHGTSTSFTHLDNILAINLPGPLALGAIDSVTVFYAGPPAETGFGSFVQTDHGGTPIVWTLSEPYGARDWWPCKQDLTDKIDSIDVLVTCPAAYRAASNGLLVSETDAGAGQKTYHWQHRYPIACYLVAFAVTNYEQYYDYAEIQTGTLPILNYVFPENLAAAQTQTPAVVPVLEFYDSLFVSYPFHKEKYGHAQFGWGGGMEHQTMSFMVNFGYELMAHELAHQWFGDHVTCGSWEDIWLNEGFATYLSGLCYERFSPNQYWPNFKQGRIGSVVSQPGGSVWVDDTTSVGRIFSGRLSYSKGAMVLHQLRWTIGDSAFFTGLRNYLNAPGIAGDFARTADLRSHLEATSGQDLDWYFDDWFYGEGYPSYQIEWSQAGNTAWVTINQTQSHPSVGFFEVPAPLRFKTGNQIFDVRLTPSASGQSFQVDDVPFAADELLLDPDWWLISANNTVTKVAVGTDEPGAFPVQIAPNPATGKVTVSTGDGRLLHGVQVFDALGKLVKTIGNQNVATCEIDLTGLPGGVYEIRIVSGKMVAIQKLIKR